MVRLIASLALLVSSIATADFYSPKEVPPTLKPSGYARGRAAAILIESATRGCSGTIISNQGHILTALHCVSECVTQIKDSKVKNFQILAPRADHIISGKSSCILNIKQEGRELGTSLEAKVVAAGAGYVEISKADSLVKELDGSASKRDYFIRLMAAGVGISGDFVILRVPSLAGRTCAPVVNRGVSIGEAIWDISYPRYSKREDKDGVRVGAPGGTAVFSSGKVSFVKNGPVNYSVQTGKEAVGLRMNRPGITINKIDSNEGSSGAGLLTPQGELLAVLNASGISIKDMSKSYSEKAYKNDKGQDVDTTGARYAVSADFIRRHVGAVYGAAVANTAFSCH